MYKIVGDDGKEYGPVHADVVRDWISNGRANAETQVQEDGSNDWISLSQIPEFASSLSPKPRISRLAIASVICGTLSLLPWPAAPIGLFCGILAHKRIRKSNGKLKGSGLATTGIVLSVLMGMFWVLILVTALNKAKEMAQEINCVNNLKQLGIGVRMHATENNGRFPYATNWCDVLVSSLGTTKVFQCPADKGNRSSYAFNTKLNGLNQTNINPSTVMLFETEKGWNASGGMEQIAQGRHHRVHVTIVDGSVITVQISELNSLRWEP